MKMFITEPSLTQLTYYSDNGLNYKQEITEMLKHKKINSL